MVRAGPRRAEDSDEDVEGDEGTDMSDGEEEAAMRLRSHNSKAAAAAAAASSQVCFAVLPLPHCALFWQTSAAWRDCNLMLILQKLYP